MPFFFFKVFEIHDPRLGVQFYFCEERMGGGGLDLLYVQLSSVIFSI